MAWLDVTRYIINLRWTQ